MSEIGELGKVGQRAHYHSTFDFARVPHIAVKSVRVQETQCSCMNTE